MQTHSDSGYASVTTSLDHNESGVLADLCLLNTTGSGSDPASHGNDIDPGSDFDWELIENNYNDDFFKDGLYDEFSRIG